MNLSDDDYRRLLTMRTGLRRFLRWSERQARAAGLTPAQHQLLLAVRGHPDRRGPTVGEVADMLLLRHHSTVELIDRADSAGLVLRRRDPDDHRIVRLQLTDAGAERLETLSALHLEELQRLARRLPAASEGLAPVQPPHGLAPTSDERPAVQIARVYDFAKPPRSTTVLVDRLWPRGLPRAGAPFETWMKDVAPSAELRQWYGHVPDRFSTFARRYRRELSRGGAREAFEQLRTLAGSGPLVLLTATRDLEHSGAEVLRRALTSG